MKIKKTKIALMPAHPSQVWLLKSIEDELRKNDQIEVLWVIRDKDISASLATELGINFKLISKASNGLLGNAVELLINVIRAIFLTWREDIDLWVTKYGAGNIAARFCGKRSVSFNDDDISVVPLIGATSYRFADAILVPNETKTGKFEYKSHHYPGFHELMYLHPDRFKISKDIWDILGLVQNEPFAFIRLVSLKAHHDVGVKGIDDALLDQIIDLLESYGLKIFISSESLLPLKYSHFNLNIPFSLVHSVLAAARIYVGDSVTMASEAALVGTTSFRLSDFTGINTSMNVYEDYGLIRGYTSSEKEALVTDLNTELESNVHSKNVNQGRTRFLSNYSDNNAWFANRILSELKS